MPPNSIGDFLGGTFGPLAFLCFLQQGVELRQNSRALQLQSDEMAESARQQRELASTTREQLALERENLNEELARLWRQELPLFVVNREPRSQRGGRRAYIHLATFRGWRH